MAACHPDRPNYGRGLCPTCYHRAYAGKRRKGLDMPESVVDRLPRADGPPIDPDTPCCDVCAADGVKLIRFNLVHGVTVKGRRTSRGAGTIQLCGHCWASAQRKTRKRKHLRAVA